VLRIPARLLGGAAALALVVHAARVAPAFLALWPAGEGAALAAGLRVVGLTLLGRIALAWLPPGPPGGHAPAELPRTLAASLALGTLVDAFLRRLAPDASWMLAAGLGLVLLVPRLLTLPGAMVPRHAPAREPRAAWEGALELLVLGWAALLATTAAAGEALTWLALAVLVAGALDTARRARGGRLLVLLFLAAPGLPEDALAFGLGAGSPLVPLVGLALGATGLVGWVRRADRRAGALAGLGFGALALTGPDPLALAGPLVLVAASAPRQRRFALTWTGASALACGLAAWRSGGYTGRGRGLLMPELVDQALRGDDWGLLWPAGLVALVLGLLTLHARSSARTIDPPVREAWALVALLVLAGAALVPAASPWFEGQALVLLAPLLALAAGLALLPPARASGPGSGD